MSFATADGRHEILADLHGLSGKTMSGGEAVLRRKFKALADEIADIGHVDGGDLSSAIKSILAGQYDPETEEYR